MSWSVLIYLHPHFHHPHFHHHHHHPHFHHHHHHHHHQNHHQNHPISATAFFTTSPAAASTCFCPITGKVIQGQRTWSFGSPNSKNKLVSKISAPKSMGFVLKHFLVDPYSTCFQTPTLSLQNFQLNIQQLPSGTEKIWNMSFHTLLICCHVLLIE